MAWEDIEVVEIVEEEIASPRTLMSDKTDTYSIPFRVSQVPPIKWVALFEKLWNNPPAHIQNHRPEIARLVGDKVILDDTNIDEIESVHFGTLQMIIDEANKQYAEWLIEMEMYQQAEHAEQQFRGHIADVINRLPLKRDSHEAEMPDEEAEAPANIVELNTAEHTNGFDNQADDTYTNGHGKEAVEAETDSETVTEADDMVGEEDGMSDEKMDEQVDAVMAEENMVEAPQAEDATMEANGDYNEDMIEESGEMINEDEETSENEEASDEPSYDANYPML